MVTAAMNGPEVNFDLHEKEQLWAAKVLLQQAYTCLLDASNVASAETSEDVMWCELTVSRLVQVLERIVPAS